MEGFFGCLTANYDFTFGVSGVVAMVSEDFFEHLSGLKEIKKS